MKRINKTIAKGEKLINKLKSNKLACHNRFQSIPENATIREEYVSCTKSNCHHGLHGPYHYAYWKDPVTKELKKKYIGRYFEKEAFDNNKSANTKQDETMNRLIENNVKTEKKNKKRKLLITA